VLRKPEENLFPNPQIVLQAGDVLLVQGAREDVLKIKDTAGVEIRPDVELSDPYLKTEDMALVEALVVPGSRLVGRTLSGIDFRARYGLQVLGLNRHGKNILQKLARVTLRAGDVLLVQGHKRRIAALDDDKAVSVLNTVQERRPNRPRAWRR
jgi:uncharacterized protein with PhoU and TrkA domain